MPKRKRKTPTIKYLVVIADLHIGCQLGLCHADGHALDDGGHYAPNKLQRVVWSWWEEFWDEIVPNLCRNEPFAVCLNGDALDGVHHQATHQWTHNLADQAKAAEKILRHVVERCEGRYYHIRGTEAHSGPSGAQEEALATTLGAIPNEAGQRAQYELWARVGGGLAHITHHIGMGDEMAALRLEWTRACLEAGRWNYEQPDWLVRSHQHRTCQIKIPIHKGFATACITPGWQLKTPFAYRVAGARQSLPQIGGCVLRGDGDKPELDSKCWTIQRAREVVV